MSEDEVQLAHFLPKREWLSDAACVGAGDVFFPPCEVVAGVDDVSDSAAVTLVAGGSGHADGCTVCDAAELVSTARQPVMCDRHADADRIERAGEHAAKRVCLGCEARTECLTQAMSWPHQPRGVFGGLNRWERQMLQAAGRAQLAELDDLRDGLGEDRCLELREHFEATGPDKVWMGVVVPGEIAVRHGVPLSLAERWMSHGPDGRKTRGRSPETLALMERLGDGEWVKRDDVEVSVRASMDAADIDAKATRMRVSASKARAVMFNRAVEARRRRGSVEEREIDGVWWMRLRSEVNAAVG